LLIGNHSSCLILPWDCWFPSIVNFLIPCTSCNF
jgi:hypothetical protein